MKTSARCLLFLFLLVLTHCFSPLTLIDARPTDEVQQQGKNDDDVHFELPEVLRQRLGDTLSEIEWLLHQLVNILSDMVDGIEKEPELLQNYHFRQILIQVIKRIDYILEHFENVGTSVLTPTVINELQRIDCIRIRLANYISQSKKYDDSQCRKKETTDKPNNGAANNDQIVPLLTQIVSILVQVTQQLDKLTQLQKGQMGMTTKYPNYPVWGTTPYPMTTYPPWTKPPSTINWDDLISQFVSSQPVVNTNPPYTTAAPLVSGSTQDWGSLISQVMDSMGGTLVPNWSTGMTTAASSATTVWEDAMNNLIGQWSSQMSTSAPPSNSMNVQQCVDNILSIINTIQGQLPTMNGTTMATSMNG